MIYKKPEKLNKHIIKNTLDFYDCVTATVQEQIVVMALKELLEYRETGLTPQTIKDMDKMYLEKCKQVNKLTCTCEMLERMAKSE